MIPILYEHNETLFSSNGIGRLTDVTKCEVVEERNGLFELTMNYPITGIHYKDIIQRRIIYVYTSALKKHQAFRIYRITKPIRGIVTIYANHISYDLSGIPISPFVENSVAGAMSGLKSHSIVTNPFSFWTDKTTQARFAVSKPCSLRSVLGGQSGSIIDTFGGEYEFDNYIVKLHEQRGQNNNVTIRYGKNLIDLTQEENCANCYTGVYPFWTNTDGVIVNGNVISAGTFEYTRLYCLDCSEDYEEQPTAEQLNLKAQQYIDRNKIGVPKVSLDVSFAQLENTQEYKEHPWLETVNLCDTVTVIFENIGVSATAKVVKTIYNVLLERYESVEIGDAKNNIADTIAKQEQTVNNIKPNEVTKSMMLSAIENATKLITGNLGGYVVLHSSAAQQEPDEILIMDTDDISTATKVWRWNKSGLGYSSTGYNGTYGTAITADGKIVADFITTGILNANIIRAGVLESADEMHSFYLNLDNGEMSISGYALESELSDMATKTELFAGTTTINGGCITTGTIKSSDKKSMEINLNAPNMISVYSQTYFHTNYTSADVTRVTNIVAKRVTPTTSDYAKYDFTGIGTINAYDLNIVNAIVNSAKDLVITVNVKINPVDKQGTLSVIRKMTGAYTETKTILNAGCKGLEASTVRAGDVTASGAVSCSGLTSTGHIIADGDLKGNTLYINNQQVVSKALGVFVYGTPSGGSSSCTFIPSVWFGTSRRFQIADESNYISFTLDYDGEPINGRGTYSSTLGYDLVYGLA